MNMNMNDHVKNELSIVKILYFVFDKNVLNLIFSYREYHHLIEGLISRGQQKTFHSVKIRKGKIFSQGWNNILDEDETIWQLNFEHVTYNNGFQTLHISLRSDAVSSSIEDCFSYIDENYPHISTYKKQIEIKCFSYIDGECVPYGEQKQQDDHDGIYLVLPSQDIFNTCIHYLLSSDYLKLSKLDRYRLYGSLSYSHTQLAIFYALVEFSRLYFHQPFQIKERGRSEGKIIEPNEKGQIYDWLSLWKIIGGSADFYKPIFQVTWRQHDNNINHQFTVRRAPNYGGKGGDYTLIVPSDEENENDKKNH